jgi:hypothetical protein
MRMRSHLIRLAWIGLYALGVALNLRRTEPKRRDVCLPTTDGAEIHTWIYSS